MKICWDNLEKLRYSAKQQCWYDAQRNRFEYAEECQYCGDSFLYMKNSLAVYCSRQCSSTGREITEKTRQKISKVSTQNWSRPEYRKQISEIRKQFRHTEESRNKVSGCNHYRWISDRTKVIQNDNRDSTEYQIWRKMVYRRDWFTCRDCGSIGGNLQAHHIFRYADRPDLRYTVWNGITLCDDCHKKICRKEQQFIRQYLEKTLADPPVGSRSEKILKEVMPYRSQLCR